MVDTGMGNLQHLREAFPPDRIKANAFASPSHGQEAQAASLRGRDHGLGVLVIGGDYRHTARVDQIGE